MAHLKLHRWAPNFNTPLKLTMDDVQPSAEINHLLNQSADNSRFTNAKSLENQNRLKEQLKKRTDH